jgi:hypothetical protein
MDRAGGIREEPDELTDAEPVPSSLPDGGRNTLLRWLRIGLAGSIAVYVALAAIWAFAVPLFAPLDESAHVDYAYQVAHGGLPLAGTHYQAEFPTLHQRSGGQYVAYHPPLYYALISPLIRLADPSSHPRVWLLAVRGVGIVLTIGTLLLVAMLAVRVFAKWDRARRYQLAIIAVGLAAGVPSLVAATASIQNDALELFLSLLALVLLAVMARDGLTARRVLVLGLVCGLGMLTRVTFGQVLVVAALTVVLLAHPRFSARPWPAAAARPRLTILRRQAAYLAPVILGPVLIAGWFYVLNHNRYGSFSGSNIAYQGVAARSLNPRMSNPLHFATDPYSWWAQLVQLGGATSSLVNNPRTVSTVIATLLTVVVVLGLGGLALRWRTFRLDRAGAILLIGLALILLISFAEIASHVSHKGSENNRYLLAALPFWGIALGVLLLALGSRRLPVIPVVIVAAQALGAITLTVSIARRQRLVAGHTGTYDALLTSMRQARVPMPSAMLAGLTALLVAGLLVQLVALVALGRRRVPAEGRTGAVEDRPTSMQPA